MEMSELKKGFKRLKKLNKKGLISDESLRQSKEYLDTAKWMDKVVKQMKEKNGNK